MAVELGEVHVPEARPDEADLLARLDERVLGNGRLYVPVRELAAAPPAYGDGVGVPEDGARLDRVDARAVRNGDVDAEVEVATEARVVEGASDDVLAVERLHRPVVGAR